MTDYKLKITTDKGELISVNGKDIAIEFEDGYKIEADLFLWRQAIQSFFSPQLEKNQPELATDSKLSI